MKMKNIIILCLLSLLLAVSTTWLRERTVYNKSSPYCLLKGFPKAPAKKELQQTPKLHLYYFFDKSNCVPCMSSIPVLNELSPEYFNITGIINDRDLNIEDEVRELTGAAFPLTGFSKYKGYDPPFWPSLIGVTDQGAVCLVLAGTPEQPEYLNKLLIELYKTQILKTATL